MLQLQANGQPLDTSGVKFNLTLKNPMFTDGLEGSYVYNINLPWTKKNKMFFGFPNRLEKYSDNLGDFYFTGSHSGRGLFTNAIGSVKASKNKGFTVNVKVGTGTPFYLLKDKMLSEIDLGGNRIYGGLPVPPITEFENVIAGEYPEFDYTLFTIKNLNYYNSTRFETSWQNNIKFINYYNNGFQSIYGEYNNLIPFPYVVYLINQVFKEAGFTISDNVFFEDADLKTLTLFNNFFKTTTLQVPDPGPPVTWDYSIGQPPVVNLQDHVPELNVLDFLKALKLFACTYFVNQNNNSVKIKFFKDILNSHEYIEYSDNILKEFSQEFSFMDGAVFKYNKPENDGWSDKYFKTDFSEIQLKDSVATVFDLAEDNTTDINEVRLVNDIDTYFIFRWDDSISKYTWQYFCYHFNDFTIGNGKQKFEFDISPLMVDNIVDDHPTSPTRNWLVPIMEQMGSNNKIVFEENGNPFYNSPGLRFAFYRGMQHASNNSSYPLGSNDVYKYDGSKIANANLSLKWEGEYGLYEKLWKAFIDWYANIRRKITFQKQMTPLEIYDFDFSKKYRINGIDYLIKEIKIPITETAILPATLECYKV